MDKASTCINCGNDLSGNFCPNCGQKRNVKRLSIKTFFEDYLSRLFGMDTNFLRTLRDLTITPGKVGNTFVLGNRVKYVGPVGYFFLISTFYILTFNLLGIDIKEFISQTSNSIAQVSSTDSNAQNLRDITTGFMSRNLKLLSFLIIPFLGLWGKVLFKKLNLNFFEHSVNALYVQGHMVFIKIVGLFVFKLSSVFISPYLLLIELPYFVWSCFGFYKIKGAKSGLKAGFLFIISYVSFMLFISIFTIIGLLIYKKLTSP